MTGTPPAALADLAVLLGPAPPAPPAELVVAAPDYATVPAEPLDAAVVLWGRPALPPGTSARSALRAAAGRELAVARIRRRSPAGFTVRAVHRVDPPVLRTGLRARARTALLRGVLVELARPLAPPRVVDEVLRAAGSRGPLGRVRLGSGGALLTMVETPSGAAVLRAAPQGGAGDPASAAGALRALAANPRVPDLHAAGVTAGASWTAESRLSGRRPARLEPRLVDDVAAFCAGLPRTQAPASAAADLASLARSLPADAPRLERVGRQLDAELAGLPGVARHGDLWSGNLLVRDGRLTGVLDWDGWTPHAVPGTDLLHLLATEDRLTRRRPLGSVYLDRPWEWDAVRRAGAAYWPSLGVTPTAGQRRAVGTAWWAAQVAADLRRTPGLAGDERWVQANVTQVLDAVERDAA